MQVEKIVLFLIERQGLLAQRLQELRKQREMDNQDYCEDDEIGEPPSGVAIVPRLMMDEYR